MTGNISYTFDELLIYTEFFTRNRIEIEIDRPWQMLLEISQMKSVFYPYIILSKIIIFNGIFKNLLHNPSIRSNREF